MSGLRGAFTLSAGSEANAWREKGYRDGAAGRAVSGRVAAIAEELAAAYRQGYRFGERSRRDRV